MPAMTKDEVLQIFRETGALLEGHFILRSGLHSRQYFQCVLGQEVARQLRARFIFVEKEEGKLVLRRGFKITPGERILVVEDVVTKGGRVQETLNIVRQNQGLVLAVAAAVDRSNGKVDLGVPFVSLLSLAVEAFEPDRLPQDLASIPAVHPGSK